MLNEIFRNFHLKLEKIVTMKGVARVKGRRPENAESVVKRKVKNCIFLSSFKIFKKQIQRTLWEDKMMIKKKKNPNATNI